MTPPSCSRKLLHIFSSTVAPCLTAALLLESSVQVYSGKVDHLHSLVSQALESFYQKGQPEQPKNVLEQTEEVDSWVPDHMEVDPNCTLDDTTTSSINLVKPLADVVLEGDGLDAAGDGGQLQSSTIAKYVLYREQAFNEFLKGNVNVNGSNSQSSESSDNVHPADGGYPVPQDMHEDDSAYCHGDPYGYERPVPDAKIEECRHPHLDSPLANISESEKQAEVGAHVSLWKQKIKQDLEEHEARPAFDINDYGERVLQKLSQSADLKNTASFADVVQGEEKHDVARSFSALLHLVNNGNIDLQRSDTTDGESLSAKPFSVRLLRHAKRRQEVQFESSKKRAVSQMTREESKDKRGGSRKESREPLVTTPTSTNDNSPLPD